MNLRATKKNKINAGTIIQSIFKTFLLSLTIISQIHFTYAQTASILPPAKTTFFDNNGNPLSSGKVYSYIPNTTTPKTTWKDAAETIPNLNPITLDAAGRALLLGSGSYRQQVYDQNNNLIWDQVTSSSGSGGGSTATGDGDLVGTIKPWAGLTAPNQYAFTYGQTLNRSSFPALFNAITSTQAVFCTSGSAIITGLSDTTNFWIGMSVELSCVPAGFTTIISKTSNSVTLAVNANTSVNINAVFFPWGNGNHSTTFNLPDLRGVTLAGNCSMGGVACSSVGSQYFGSQGPSSIGALGGQQSSTLLLANVPPNIESTGFNSITVGIDSGPFNGGVIPAMVPGFAISSLQDGAAGAAGTFHPISGTSAWGSVASLHTNTPIAVNSVNTGSGGSQVPYSIIPPERTVNYIIKTTPDQNSSSASGVTSLGLMTGDIACGAGVTCTGNTISVNIGTGVTSIGGMSGAIACGSGLTCSGNVIDTTTGVEANVPLTLFGDTNIDNTMCKKTLNGNNVLTVTLPSISGFPTDCAVRVCNIATNDNTHRALRLSGFPSPSFIRLYMQQCETVSIVNGVWQVTSFPGRFRPTFTPSWYVDPSGSNNNDGFISSISTNAFADLGNAISIAQNEYDLTLSGVPSFLLTPTVFSGPAITFPRGGTGLGVFYVLGNGGIATLRTTGNVILEEYDFAGYLIFSNIQFDCSIAGSHPCFGLFMHQQVGTDLASAAPATNPNYFNGGGVTDLAIWCDSQCKINSSQPLVFTGTWGTGVRLDLGAIASINNGITATGTIFAGPMIQASGGSQLLWSGQLTLGGGATVSRLLYVSNASAIMPTLTVSGALAGGQSYFVINNGIMCNQGTALPGSAGATTQAGSINGQVVASGGTCVP